MKYLVSPEFSKKMTPLKAEALGALSAFVAHITTNEKEQILNETEKFKVQLLGNEVFLSKQEGLSVYFTFGKEDNEEYVLLLDLVTETRTPLTSGFFAVKDPTRNSRFNPSYNTAINPRYNTQLNPRYNTTINPRYNTTINPRYNTTINPRYNTTINPRYNTTINPRYNTALNPRYNMRINPRMNPSFGGPYIYAVKNLQREGYLVRANNQVNLQFDMNGEFQAFYVMAGNGMQIEFDTNNDWLGYLVPANDEDGILLQYTESGEWVGMVV